MKKKAKKKKERGIEKEKKNTAVFPNRGQVRGKKGMSSKNRDWSKGHQPKTKHRLWYSPKSLFNWQHSVEKSCKDAIILFSGFYGHAECISFIYPRHRTETAGTDS